MTSASGAGELRIAADARDEPEMRRDTYISAVARPANPEVSRILSRRETESADVRAERARFVRELHDGILQTLSGATLQLEAIAGLIDSDPGTAKQRLRSIRQMLTDDQRELRKWVDGVRCTAAHAGTPIAQLTDVLRRLCRRAAHQYEVAVELRAPDAGSMSATMGEHICRIVQEGLSNIGKHALAKAAYLDVEIDAAQVRIVIRDDGVGFPFHGTFGLAELFRDDIGPRSLKDRVASLSGSLILTSHGSGSRLEITLPTARM